MEKEEKSQYGKIRLQSNWYAAEYILINPLTVHENPPFIGYTPNRMACGMARQKATIQIPNMNLTARDSFDMVRCLLNKWKTCRLEYIVIMSHYHYITIVCKFGGILDLNLFH